MAERIHTSKVLNNSYYEGEHVETDFNISTISVNPLISDQYDYAMTEDIVLLNERKDTAEKIYEIYQQSPYKDNFFAQNSNIIKIPKENIKDVFYYIKDELSAIKTLSAYEMVLAINEFFDFNYDYIVSKVLSPQMKAEILEDYYNNMGMKNRMEQSASTPLF